MDIVRYQVSKTNGGPAYHEWTGVELEAGYSVTVAGKMAREARRAASKALRAWAACVKKVFGAPG